MRTRMLWCVSAIVLATLSTSVMAGGEVNLFYGRKNLDTGLSLGSGTPEEVKRWVGDLESQDEWGILFTYGHDWPVALVVDFLSSSQTETLSYYAGSSTYGTKGFSGLRGEITTWELDFGVRKYWGKKVQVYVGGGVAWINGEFDIGLEGTALRVTEDDNGLGYFVNGGVVWRAGRWFNLGADLRYSDASGDFPLIFDQKLELGGTHYGLFVGGRW